jgi:hypothetical protein
MLFLVRVHSYYRIDVRSGCFVIEENLETHEQRVFPRHEEVISTIAIQNDGTQLASAGGGSPVGELIQHLR